VAKAEGVASNSVIGFRTGTQLLNDAGMMTRHQSQADAAEPRKPQILANYLCHGRAVGKRIKTARSVGCTCCLTLLAVHSRNTKGITCSPLAGEQTPQKEEFQHNSNMQ
jgi:hypothetical protein